MSDTTPETADDTPEPTPRPRVRKGVNPKTRHIYGREWIEICNMVKEGVPVHKIAKSYGVAPSSIYRGIKKRNVQVGVYAKSSDEIEGDKTRKELVERIRKTKDDDFKFTTLFQQEIVKIKLKADRDGKSLGHFEKDIKACKLAIDAIKAGTDNKWRILGLDQDNQDADKQLPELPIRQMTDAEVTAIRDRQMIEDADLTEIGEDELHLEDDIVEGAEDDDDA